jgi:hypothetical protein
MPRERLMSQSGVITQATPIAAKSSKSMAKSIVAQGLFWCIVACDVNTAGKLVPTERNGDVATVT